jgi:hypothetical protein
VESALVFVTANDNAGAGLNRSALHHLFFNLSNANAQPLTM